MEQSPWETKGFSASQEIPRILGNQRVHYCIRKCLPPGPIPHSISPCPRLSVWIFRNNIRFYGEELSAPRATPKLEDHPLSAVRDCLFNIFAATLHIGRRSSTRDLKTRHAVVTRDPLITEVTGNTMFNFSFYYCSFMEYNYSLFQFRIKLWNY